MQSYLNFDLQIVPAAQGYLAQVIFSPVGQAAALIVLPFSEHELQQPLDMLGGAVRHVRPVGNKANAGLPTVTPGELGPKELGTQLFKAVVRDEIVVCLRRSLDAARRAEAGLRIRLRLTGAPALAALPWEYLFDPSRDQFLALVDELSIVRYLDLPEPEAVLPVAPPLRVLAVLSDPVNIAPRLDVGREWALLQKAISGLGADQVVLDRLPAVTVDSLRQRLGADDVHVLHFIGHGWFDAGGNGLVCEDTAGRGVKVAADVLGVLQYEDLRDVVLIGHSYGGMVATGVTDRAEGRVAKLIYLDAFAPVVPQRGGGGAHRQRGCLLRRPPVLGAPGLPRRDRHAVSHHGCRRHAP